MRYLAFALLVVLSAVSSNAAAQSRVRFPAAFYDIELRESLVSGTSSRMGASEGMRATAGSASNGGFNVPEAAGNARFLITNDSLLFRNGREVVAVAVAEFTAVDEVRAMGRADLAWVRIQYTRAGVAKELFVRRYQSRSQSELLTTLQTVMARYAERRAQTP